MALQPELDLAREPWVKLRLDTHTLDDWRGFRVELYTPAMKQGVGLANTRGCVITPCVVDGAVARTLVRLRAGRAFQGLSVAFLEKLLDKCLGGIPRPRCSSAALASCLGWQPLRGVASQPLPRLVRMLML